MAQGTSVAAPEQLAVDEVRDPAEEQADRRGGAIASTMSSVGRLPRRGKQERRPRRRPSSAAVERHAAVPDRERLQRVAEVEARPVEQDVAEAAAEHHAERDVDQEVVDVGRGQPPARPPHEALHVLPPEHQTEDVGERVPSDRERPDLDQDRIDRRKGQRQHQHPNRPALPSRALMARLIGRGGQRPQGDRTSASSVSPGGRATGPSGPHPVVTAPAADRSRRRRASSIRPPR